MAKLTPEDRDNYNNLKDAFSQRSVIGDTKEPKDKTLEKIIKLIEIEKIPTTTDLLHQKIDSLDLYLKVIEIQAITLEFNKNSSNPDEKEKLNQHFFDSIRELKRSLKVIGDENLNLTDEIENFQSDALFIQLLPKDNPNDTFAKESIEKLLKNQHPKFSEKQINKLTQAWETAVSAFVEDARKPGDEVDPGTSTTFAHFFRIHKELEILYDRLAATEAVQSSK